MVSSVLNWYENDYEHAAIIGDIIGKKQADHCQ
jgi:hypothetical protein